MSADPNRFVDGLEAVSIRARIQHDETELAILQQKLDGANGAVRAAGVLVLEAKEHRRLQISLQDDARRRRDTQRAKLDRQYALLHPVRKVPLEIFVYIFEMCLEGLSLDDFPELVHAGDGPESGIPLTRGRYLQSRPDQLSSLPFPPRRKPEHQVKKLIERMSAHLHQRWPELAKSSYKSNDSKRRSPPASASPRFASFASVSTSVELRKYMVLASEDRVSSADSLK